MNFVFYYSVNGLATLLFQQSHLKCKSLNVVMENPHVNELWFCTTVYRLAALLFNRVV